MEPRHRKTLVEGSAIDPEVIADRGVRSVRKRSAPLPKVYSRRQRARGGGILFTLHRPNGEAATIFRPDEPRPDNPGHKYEQEPKWRGGSGNVLDAHPSLHHLIDDKDVPVVFVEGVKKADSITSAARKTGTDLLAVAISGVWNWVAGVYDEQGRKRKRRPGEPKEPIPDLFDIPVKKRRRALICFDSDMLRKPEVQQAAEELAQHLSRRGAQVEIVYLEDQPDGSKTGADDFLAGGGTLGEMLALARPYTPGDLQVERVRRDERLEATLGYLVGVFEKLAVKTSAECSLRAVFRVCLMMLEKHGTLGEEGIGAVIPAMDGAVLACVSQPTFSKRMTDLEEAELVRRIKADRPEHADSYVFLVPRRVKLYNNGTKEGTKEGREGRRNKTYTEVYRGYKALHPLPEVSWSSPGPRKQKRGVVSGTRRPRQGAPTGGSESKRRPGKKRDEVVRYVVEGGGSATREELLERFGTEKTAWKDFKRNVLSEVLGVRRQYRGKPLSVGPPVIELTDEGVRLVDDWEAAWEKHRLLSEEDEAAKKRSRDTLDKRVAWRHRNETPADRAPTEEEMAAGREARQKRRRIEELAAAGMRRDFAAREVIGADGYVEDLSPVEEPPPGTEHSLDCECQDCSATVPTYVRLAW